MTQTPTPPTPPPQPMSNPTTHVYVNQAPSNGLGTGGFIVSILGWFTCGLFCPIGLLLSLIALFKPPRGLAIAGVCIGGLGSLFLALFGAGIIALLLGIGIAAATVEQENAIQQGKQRIDSIYHATGLLPDNTAGNQAVLSAAGSNVTLQYERLDAKQYRITAPGFDDKLGTSDDIKKTYSFP